MYLSKNSVAKISKANVLMIAAFIPLALSHSGWWFLPASINIVFLTLINLTSTFKVNRRDKKSIQRFFSEAKKQRITNLTFTYDHETGQVFVYIGKSGALSIRGDSSIATPGEEIYLLGDYIEDDLNTVRVMTPRVNIKNNLNVGGDVVVLTFLVDQHIYA